MAGIDVTRDFQAKADTVWATLRDFGGLSEWMPGIGGCELEGEGIGSVRSVAMGPATVKERLESFDDAARSLSYSIVEGPLPAQDYLATIRVTETGAESCRVDWTARFELPEGLTQEQIAPALEGAYGGALDALKQKLGA